MAKISPFEIIKHLNEKTKLDFDIKEYSPWIINKGLSFHKETLAFADIMNKMSQLDKDIQYAFYLNAIPKGKRYGKWEKPSKDTDLIELIRHKYFCNSNIAKQYASLMSEEEKQKISESKGGRNGAR
jgi:hypothetical protein